MLAGVAGIANETVGQDGERPTLLLVFAAMVGLPAFLRGDEAVKQVAAPPPAPPPAPPVEGA